MVKDPALPKDRESDLDQALLTVMVPVSAKLKDQALLKDQVLSTAMEMDLQTDLELQKDRA